VSAGEISRRTRCVGVDDPGLTAGSAPALHPDAAARGRCFGQRGRAKPPSHAIRPMR